MRALLAGLFVFAATLVTVIIIASLSPNQDLPWWGIPFVLATMSVSIVAALFIFNKQGYRSRASWKNAEEQIREFDEKGLLTSQTFKATRVFEVEELEDEGLHYFIELDDRSVLYLSGQYLYDYPETSGDEGNQKIGFPCSEFTIRRHKTAGYVVDIVCSGNALPIDCEAPSFDRKDGKLDLIPMDGQLFRDRSYDELKKERLKGRVCPK
jgi:hypothetical protein